jgi:hypothetical protein
MVHKQRKEGKSGMTGDPLSSAFGPMTKLAWDVGTKSVGFLTGQPELIAAASIKTYADLVGNVPRLIKNSEILLGRKLGIDKKLQNLYKKIKSKF